MFVYIYISRDVTAYVAAFQTIFLFTFPSEASYLYIGAVYFSFLLEQTSSNIFFDLKIKHVPNPFRVPRFHMIHIKICPLIFLVTNSLALRSVRVEDRFIRSRRPQRLGSLRRDDLCGATWGGWRWDGIIGKFGSNKMGCRCCRKLQG